MNKMCGVVALKKEYNTQNTKSLKIDLGRGIREIIADEEQVY